MLKICENVRALAELITDKVKELYESELVNERWAILDFAVEDVPQTITDERKDWNNATGVYGVSTITTPFDNESLLLAIGYYGGMEEISTITVKTHYDIDWEELTGNIAQEISYQISLEIPGVNRFLVKLR